jgi:outer membrane protein assembly factor BamB
MVETAVRDGDVALLDRVAETYPNAAAAGRARVECGRLLSSEGKPLEAVRHLTDAYVRHAAHIESLEVMRMIADAYADAGRRDAAWRWLTRAAREYPTARVAIGDRRVSLEEYRARLGDLRAAVEPSCPRMTLPLTHTFLQEYEHPFEVLEPFFEGRPRAAWDGYYVYGDAKLQYHDAAGGAARWPQPATCRMKPDLLTATNELAVFATRHQITALVPRDGSEVWRYGKYPADLDDALADHERFDFFRAHALGAEQLVSLQDDGRLVSLALSDGRVIWEHDAELRPSGATAISDLWFAYAVGQAGSQVLRVLDLITGEVISSFTLPADGRAERLAATLEDQLLVFASQSISAYEPRSGERLWTLQRERSILTETVRIDLDGVYFSDDGRHVIKLGERGRILWQSDPLPGRPSDGLAVTLVGSHLVVSTERAVGAIDGFDGRTLWQGTLPENAMLGRRAVTEAYVVGVDTTIAEPPAPLKAYFFDHRGGSGRLAADGGLLDLGVIPDFRFIAVRDDAILVVTDRAIHGRHSGMKNGE